MLRIYCLQQWYNLSDPGAEEALYDIQSMRAFCNLGAQVFSLLALANLYLARRTLASA